jgi:ureidoglycolate hydrolase
MDENWLQIRSFEGKGFQPLVMFNGWRVAVLNYVDDIHPERNNMMERHTETDEVFVLMKGRGILFLGGNASEVDAIHPQAMEIGIIYNVRRNTWHTILLSQDASVLIIENCDTNEQNTELVLLPQESHLHVVKIA